MGFNPAIIVDLMCWGCVWVVVGLVVVVVVGLVVVVVVGLVVVVVVVTRLVVVVVVVIRLVVVVVVVVRLVVVVVVVLGSAVGDRSNVEFLLCVGFLCATWLFVLFCLLLSAHVNHVCSTARVRRCRCRCRCRCR